MYVYFDENGTLKEIISEKSFRVGDSKKDKIYVYWEGEHSPISGWVKYRKPNGKDYPASIEECFYQIGDEMVGKELPIKPLRNLKYFSYDHTYKENGETHVGYKFYEITIPDAVLNSSLDDEEVPTENNMIVARIRFVIDDNKNGKVDEADSIETLGALVFSVETNIGILTDSSINETQYNYLIQLVSMKLGTNTKSVKVSQLPSTGVAGTIYYVEKEDNGIVYDAYFWNGTEFVFMGTTSYGLYTKQEGDEFEVAIQALWNAELNDYKALMNSNFENYKNLINDEMDNYGNLIKSAASGSPKGVYNTLTELQNAYPAGATGIYVIKSNGHWYYWEGTAWSDGGVYQSTGVDDGLFYNTYEKHITSFAFNSIYVAEQVRFIKGKKYKISIHFDNDFATTTNMQFNASTVNDHYVEDGIGNQNVVQALIDQTRSWQVLGNDFYIFFSCNADAYGLSYFFKADTLYPHTIKIEEYDDFSNKKLKKLEMSTYQKSDYSKYVRSFLMKSNINYYMKLKETGTLLYEFRKIDALPFNNVVNLIQAFGDGQYEYIVKIPNIDASLFADANGRSIEIYYEDNEDYKIDEYIPFKDIILNKSFPIKYYDITNLKAIMGVNFQAGKKYLFRIKTNGNYTFSNVNFTTFNGSLSSFSSNIVEENFVKTTNVYFEDSLYYIFECSQNADNLLFWVMSGASGWIFDFSIFEYDDSKNYNVNPIYRKREASDPTIWFDGNVMYCLGTPWKQTNYGVLRSTDGIHWEDTGNYLFDESVIELFTTYTNGIWAPSIFKIGDDWLMYISLNSSANNSIIAVCKSKNPFGKFTLVRVLQNSSVTGIIDTIDPLVVWGEDNKLYMFYGSTGGIYRIELTQDGLNIQSGSTPVHVAGLTVSQDSSREKVFEGSALFYYNDYWYFLVSSGNYSNNTYKLKIGRSKTITGTFKDANGNNMVDGYATTILQTTNSNDNDYGPGHCSRPFVMRNGEVYIYYHSHNKLTEYNVPNVGIKSRMLYVQKLIYENGWFTCKNQKIEKIIGSFN